MARPIPAVIAAVDLGSNSFHMVVARYSHGQLTIVDRLRETVRLGGGLDEHGRLERSAIDRALACIERFGQRLKDMKAESVRVVGTNALRQAKRKGAFLDRARDALGHPIEVISGIEEARLIYMGVAHTMPSEPGRRLVVDIGGGSTELIIGQGFQTKRLDSLHMGCVSMSTRYFADGEINEKRMKRARLAARVELEPIEATFKNYGWEHAIGSSGTVRAISDMIKERGSPEGLITPAVLNELEELALRAGNAGKLRFQALTVDRIPVFAGGLVILMEVMHMLDIKVMRVADGALREGLLYDLLGRHNNEDARVRTVRAMEARYHVDPAQAERVEGTARSFLQQVQPSWGLEDPLADLILSWAARLHEVGLDISYSHYQAHGAYLLRHADMPGFPSDEQKLLACIVGAHRRKLHSQALDDLTPPWHVKAEFLIVLLRLGVLLHRGRSTARLPPIGLTAKGRTLQIEFPGGWLDDHPLTRADLEQEVEYLKAAGFKLRIA